MKKMDKKIKEQKNCRLSLNDYYTGKIYDNS